MSPQELMTRISGIEPFNLKAVALLRERRRATGQAFPKFDNIVQLNRAVLELQDHAKKARAIIKHLEDLPAVPATYIPAVAAYSL